MRVVVGGGVAAYLGTHLPAVPSRRDHGRAPRVDEVRGCPLQRPVLRDRSETGGRARLVDPLWPGLHALRRGDVRLLDLAMTTSSWPRLNEYCEMMSGTRIAIAVAPQPTAFSRSWPPHRAHSPGQARSSEHDGRTRSASMRVPTIASTAGSSVRATSTAITTATAAINPIVVTGGARVRAARAGGAQNQLDHPVGGIDGHPLGDLTVHRPVHQIERRDSASASATRSCTVTGAGNG